MRRNLPFVLEAQRHRFGLRRAQERPEHRDGDGHDRACALRCAVNQELHAVDLSVSARQIRVENWDEEKLLTHVIALNSCDRLYLEKGSDTGTE